MWISSTLIRRDTRSLCLSVSLFLCQVRTQQEVSQRDFSGGLVVESSPSSAGGVSSMPGQEARIPHASGPKKPNMKQKQHCNKFNKDFKKKEEEEEEEVSHLQARKRALTWN